MVLKRKKQSSSCVWSVECGVVVLFVILVVVFHLFRVEGRDTIYIYIDFVRVCACARACVSTRSVVWSHKRNVCFLCVRGRGKRKKSSRAAW